MVGLDAATAGLVFIGALATAVAGAAYLVRRGVAFIHRVESLVELTNLELRHNGGSSIKDAVAKIPDLEDRMRRIEDATTANTVAVARLAEAIPVVALTHPPDLDPADNKGE